MAKVESYYWGDWLVLVYPECPFCLPGVHRKDYDGSDSVHRCHHPRNDHVFCDTSHHQSSFDRGSCPFKMSDPQPIKIIWSK